MTDEELIARLNDQTRRPDDKTTDRLEAAERIETLIAERDEFERLWEHSDFNLKLKTKELKTSEAAIKKAVRLMCSLYADVRTHEMDDFIIRYGETE